MKTKKLLLAILVLFILGPVIGQNIPTPQAPNTNSGKKGTYCETGNCEDGWGKKIYEHGYYEGFFQNGNRDGYGLFNWTESGDYIGFWSNDKMHGYGCYLGIEKDLIGQYVNGSLHGYGYTKELKNEKWVYGYFQSYLVKDAYTFYDNGVTTGCVAGDCENKYGRFKWNNGDSFTGFFQNGKMFMGSYTFASGDKYEGMFNSNNNFHGQGRYFYKEGGYYGGEWNNGIQEGIGYYHNKDYVRQIGVWSNGNLVRSLE